ncbi:MAG: PD-(D/E)XK nuclease domain-containing protein [Elusimicrobiota bacterium]|jgi:hypothetical protein|nr:PD-(D/E)XK nuclease domain-containing protein [Elusimicrobiota bacterium]
MAKREIRFFNTTGPCNPDDHYMLALEDRLAGVQLERYIKDQIYWILHAHRPRQTGKTTVIMSFIRKIMSENEAIACYASVEMCQGISEPEKAIPTICSSIKNSADRVKLPIPAISAQYHHSMLNDTLRNLAKLAAPKPLIVCFDEIDTLEDKVLISFLRQLIDGFASRGIGKFPVSIVLVSMRDLSDYIMTAKNEAESNSILPFNKEYVSLSNFHKDDIAKLFSQRTAETGQKITEEALDYVYEQSKGQPWIVNSLFARATLRILKEDSRETVTKELIEQAREQMLLASDWHLDSIVFRLKELHLYKVIEALMIGESEYVITQSDEFKHCLNFGIVSKEHGTLTVANPIYREVLARVLTNNEQSFIPSPEWEWKKSDGSLDMETLLKEFQKIWRANSELWEEKSDYTEAFPHLLLQAFLQRVLNGGGHIDREYAAGRGSLDLRVEYNKKKYIIEVKILRDYNTLQQIKERGFQQITRYRDRVAPKVPAYLVIFDRRSESKKASWDERITWTQEAEGIIVVGC